MTSRTPRLRLALRAALLAVLAPLVVLPAPAPADRPTPTSARGSWLRFEVTTANVRSFPVMPQGRVRADLDTLRGLGGTVLFQEIEPDRYKRALRSRFQASRVAFLDRTPVPVALDDAWTIEDRDVEVMHRGRAGVSPTRFVTWLRVARTSGDRTVRFVVMNTHFVSGAWNGRPNKDDAWRKKRWNDHFDAMRRLVRGFNAAGLTVVGGGDFNRTIARGLRRFTGAQRWLYSDAGIDKLFVAPAPGGARVAVKKTDSTRGFSDHAFRTAVLKIGPPRG